MKPGRTVHIRINPKDCMSCVDVVLRAGYNPGPMSFAQVVSSTLSVVLESLRNNSIIPDRQGFEYADIMSPWKDDVKADRGRKLGITKALELSTRPVLPSIAPDPAMARKKVQFDELAMRWNADPDNMSQGEQDLMHELALELNPI